MKKLISSAYNITTLYSSIKVKKTVKIKIEKNGHK